jgi:hypothetical protein
MVPRGGDGDDGDGNGKNGEDLKDFLPHVRFKFPLRLLLGEIAVPVFTQFFPMNFSVVVPKTIAPHIVAMSLTCEGADMENNDMDYVNCDILRSPCLEPYNVKCVADEWGIAYVPVGLDGVCFVCVDSASVVSIEVPGSRLSIRLHTVGSYTIGTLLPEVPSWESLYTDRKGCRLGEEATWKITTCIPTQRLVVTCFCYNIFGVVNGNVEIGLLCGLNYPMNCL